MHSLFTLVPMSLEHERGIELLQCKWEIEQLYGTFVALYYVAFHSAGGGCDATSSLRVLAQGRQPDESKGG